MSLLGEASVNLYYTALNIYGWVMWTRKDRQDQYVLRITRSSSREIAAAAGLFCLLLSCRVWIADLAEAGFCAAGYPLG